MPQLSICNLLSLFGIEIPYLGISIAQSSNSLISNLFRGTWENLSNQRIVSLNSEKKGSIELFGNIYSMHHEQDYWLQILALQSKEL